MRELDKSAFFKETLEKKEFWLPNKKADFLGSQRVINGFVVGKGKNLLALSLNVRDLDVFDGDLSIVRKALLAIYKDSVDLSRAIKKRERMKNISFIFGVTNKRFARLAINKFGFKKADLKPPLSLRLKGFSTVIWTTPKEFSKNLKALGPKYRKLSKK